jgi:lysophospholipid acyltransferase (LPLAT)-like uncharacterized protein
LRLTIRIKVVDPTGLKEDERAIYAFWHDRILMTPFLFKKIIHGPFTAIISRHKDGELISRTVGWFGIRSSRGSTTRGGKSALKDLIELAHQGYNIAITPDGPKGPRHVAQMGALQAAKATGLPIYPLAYGARKKKL